MRLDLDAGRSLGQGLLRLCRQALAERRWEIAEHLLSALQELAKTEPACQATVEQALPVHLRQRASSNAQGASRYRLTLQPSLLC